jgi:transposase
VGIFLPAYDELFIYGVTSKVTSDCLIDRLVEWWEMVRLRFAHITTLVINLDNGPEKHSRRTQFLRRIVEFAQLYGLKVRLAYYPPYHSKYNAIERCWGILENHWNGSLLDTIDSVIQFARTMTWNGNHPIVSLVTATYTTGVRLTKDAMEALEAQVMRLAGLEKWFVDILPAAPLGQG